MGDHPTPDIAIMTWYQYRNFGTALQASALYAVISGMGYSPCFIQYDPAKHRPSPDTTCFDLCKKLITYPFRHLFSPKRYVSPERERLFETFLGSRIHETPVCDSAHELAALNRLFDAFVCGSDQIWSPLYFDENYFLAFVDDPSKMISYAPSIGTYQIADTEIRTKMTALISRFQHLSVRETYGSRIIQELTGQEARVVLDPTLLLTSDEWDDYAAATAVPELDSGYILCYFLRYSAKYKKFVKKLSAIWNLQIVEIPVWVLPDQQPDMPFEAGPCEFVSLIKHASFVCTDSFHGMAFAVNYRVPFFVFKRFADNDPENQNSRVIHLSEQLKLENRLVAPVFTKEIIEMRNCDFSAAHEKMALLRESSVSFLRNALQTATNPEL